MLILLKSLNNHYNKFTIIVGPKTHGQFYWKAMDICRELNIASTSSLTRYFPGKLKRLSDVSEKYKRSPTTMLSTDEIYKLFEYLPNQSRNKEFETWFRNINSGSITLLALERHEFYKCCESILHSAGINIANTNATATATSSSSTSAAAAGEGNQNLSIPTTTTIPTPSRYILSYKFNPFICETKPIHLNEYVHDPEMITDKDGKISVSEESKKIGDSLFTLPQLVDIIKLIPSKEEKNDAFALFNKLYEKSQQIAAASGYSTTTTTTNTTVTTSHNVTGGEKNGAPSSSSSSSNSMGEAGKNGGNGQLPSRPSLMPTTHVEADEMMSIVYQDKCFNYYDRMTGKNYKFAALDLKWDDDSIRSCYLFPFSLYNAELKKNLLYVPMEVDK